jgi:hypothetical protein
MGTVILDAELKAKLNGLNEPLDLRDPDGTLVGQIVPGDAYTRLLYEWAKLDFARQEAEEKAAGVVRAWDGKSGKTTAEVLEGVRRLEEQLRQQEGGR